MTFCSVRDFRNSSKQVWDTLDAQQFVLLTNNGKPRAVMLPVTEEDFESVMSMLLQVRALWAVRDIQKSSADAGLDNMSMDEIDEEIAAARADRQS